MLRTERLTLILREINLHNKVLSAQLSEQLAVSEDTIRRDLNELSDEGVIVKVHGGAIGKTFHYPFAADEKIYALAAKQKIAEKTIGLFRKNMTILLEGGTTIIEIAKKIPPGLHATFYTVSPQVALTLSQHESIEVYTIGGRLEKNAVVHTGASVINELAGIKMDLCIIGANGFSVEAGLTDLDREIVQVNKAMIRASAKTAVVTISEKLGSVQKMKICNFNMIDYLVTELQPGSAALSAYKNEKLTRL